jgi:hypothetical protein
MKQAEHALSMSLNEIPESNIIWPTFQQQEYWSQLTEAKYPRLSGRWGFVDGKNYRVQRPTSVDLQNAQYNGIFIYLYKGWLHATLITGVILYGVDGTVVWIRHNCPGSWNDGEMSREMRIKLSNPALTNPETGVVSDSAFPVSGNYCLIKGDMEGFIFTPLKHGDLNRASPELRDILQERSNQITSLRQACEWGMGSAEKCYRILLRPLPYDQDLRKLRLRNIYRLYNFRVRTTGISQIRNYFHCFVQVQT